MKVYVKGSNCCIQRKSDIYRYRRYIEANGHELVSRPEDGDIVLLWGCSFRKDYHDHSIQMIHECQKYKGELIVCGCLPAIAPENLKEYFNGRYFAWKQQDSAMPEIFGDKGLPFKDFGRIFAEKSIDDIEDFRKRHPESKTCFHDQFIKLFVSEGCLCNCTYCSEIRSLPPYKSFPIDELVAECRRVKDKTGQNKVLLCADSLGDYGRDISSSLTELTDAILAIDDIQVGLSNFNPQHFVEYFNELTVLLELEKIFFMDLCIQSASDRILKLMNRKYCKAELEKMFAVINESGFKECETDVIVGFPSETEEEFLETLDFLVRYHPKYVQISGYMDACGAESAKLTGKISKEQISERLSRMKGALDKCGVLYDKVGPNALKDWPDLS